MRGACYDRYLYVIASILQRRQSCGLRSSLVGCCSVQGAQSLHHRGTTCLIGPYTAACAAAAAIDALLAGAGVGSAAQQAADVHQAQPTIARRTVRCSAVAYSRRCASLEAEANPCEP
jgi:hypothetical protein